MPGGKLQVRSSAFQNGGAIPARYAMKGGNVSPPLAWAAGPAGTRSYALVADDPDAPGGTFVHWLAWNLTGTSLPEGASGAHMPAGAVEGTTSWRRPGYGGPQPPSGTHRYFFRIYALDTEIDLGPSATRDQLDAAMQGHQLASGSAMGTYAAR